MQRPIQWTMACLLTLTAVTFSPVMQPERALAANATVATCNETNFDAALDAVQSSGGGTLSFSCSGTITFSGQKLITSSVTIVGGGTVTLSGGGTTRMFRVEIGAGLDLVGLTIQDANGLGKTPNGYGGAILNYGTVTLTTSTFTNNTAKKGSVIYSEYGSLTVTESTISGNVGTHEGGAIFNAGPLTITASNFIGNEGVYGGALYNAFSTTTITASTFTDNTAREAAGAIWNTNSDLTITASTFTGNIATRDIGGAIFGKTSSNLTVSASSFSSNRAVAGGAIYFNTGTSTVTVIDSTFTDNQATNTGAALFNADGHMSVTASTFTGNSATSGAGAILNGDGTMDITASTIVGNEAGNRAGGLYEIRGQTTISSSIVAGNSSPDGANCLESGGGAIVSDGSNLSDDDTCDFTAAGDTQNSTLVNLGAPADNGGPTPTMLPAVDSDAVDAASCALSSPQDQRGVTRPTTGTGCDIGAVEVSGTVPVQIFAVYSTSGPVVETGAAALQAIAYGPAGVSLDYDFDCDDDGSYETQGSGTGTSSAADCTFLDSGDNTVGVRACDTDDGANCDTATTIVAVDNLDPTIAEVTNSGPADEGSPVTITVTASDPAGGSDPLMYEFDCNDDGAYEIGPQSAYFAECVFNDNGSLNVPVRVTDGDGGEALGGATVSVHNVAPAVAEPSVDFEPSNEGQRVVASATFSDPGSGDSHTCTVDYGEGAQAGTVDGLTCTGPDHTYIDDDPTNTASDNYTVTVVVTDDDEGSGDASTLHTVNNVPPTIDSVTTNGPVPQGQPVLITVNASDIGVLDTLTYRFDCNDDGSFETAGAGNQGNCSLDPAAATATIGVQVMDDDLGVATSSVEVGQTLTMCLNPSTGAVSAAGAGGNCDSGAFAMTMPAPYPVIFCTSVYTGGLHWAPTGSCATSERPHLVPNDGPLHYCKHLWSNTLRAPSIPGQCAAYELAGVIPG